MIVPSLNPVWVFLGYDEIPVPLSILKRLIILAGYRHKYFNWTGSKPHDITYQTDLIKVELKILRIHNLKIEIVATLLLVFGV